MGSSKVIFFFCPAEEAFQADLSYTLPVLWANDQSVGHDKEGRSAPNLVMTN